MNYQGEKALFPPLPSIHKAQNTVLRSRTVGLMQGRQESKTSAPSPVWISARSIFLCPPQGHHGGNQQQN